MKRLLTLMLLLGVFISYELNAQLATPAPSPAAKMMQTVGLTDVTVEYSRPGKKGRTIFGEDALVSYGKVWRTGANAATKISFSDDVKLEGKMLKAGSYAILTKPGKASWDVHFYNYEGGSWGSYVEKDPAAIVTVAPIMLPIEMESFTIMINNMTSESATLDLVWDNVLVSMKMAVDSEAQVMAAIDDMMSGPSAGDYYAAGAYYHDAGKDLEKALMWVQKATKTDNPRYWQVRKESLILADLGRYKDAIAAAKLSADLAEKAGNDEYVKMNKKSIEMWMNK